MPELYYPEISYLVSIFCLWIVSKFFSVHVTIKQKHMEHVGTRWNILFQRCSANKHRMVRMSTVTQNCWGAPLTCKACFGAAALRCSTLRTSHWMTDVTSPDSPDTWHEHESESETECVPICPDVATEVIFAMELDGQFAHVAPKITEPKGRWWHGDCNVSAAPKNSLCT